MIDPDIILLFAVIITLILVITIIRVVQFLNKEIPINYRVYRLNSGTHTNLYFVKRLTRYGWIPVFSKYYAFEKRIFITQERAEEFAKSERVEHMNQFYKKQKQKKEKKYIPPTLVKNIP